MDHTICLLLGFLFVFSTNNLFTMQVSYNLPGTEKYTPRGLLIFLDDTEKDNIRAASSDLLIALAQQAGPILVSTSLLKNIFGEYGKNIPQEKEYVHLFSKSLGKVGKEESEALIKIYNELSDPQSKRGLYQNRAEKVAYKYILLKALNFNPDQWIVKKVSDYLHLFIPISYLNTHHISVEDVLKNNAQSTSAVELQLGLRVNHMVTSNIEDIIAQPLQEAPDTSYFMQAVYNDATQASDIFCLQSEYTEGPIPLLAWTILMMGHGYVGGKIAALAAEDFKKFLAFLNNKIICRLFVYNSCFAAGLNIEIAYKDLERMLQRTYSFPIIMHALTDAVVVSMGRELEVDSNGNLMLTATVGRSFKAFFDAAFQPEITNYKNVVQHIFRFGPTTRPNDTPQIKMPGLEWFSVLETDQIAAIGKILVVSRDPHLPLNIEKFFRINPRILLLYADDISFELQLNSNIEAVVSMVPGDAIHRLTKISSTTKNVNDILSLFMKVEMLGFKKIFFIKEIQGADKSIQNAIVVYTKVPGAVPSEDKYSCVAYYLDEGIAYFKPSEKSKVQQSYDTEQYQGYLQIATQEPQQIPDAVYLAAMGWEFPSGIHISGPFNLSPRAIIGTIKTENNESLADILEAVKNRQSNGAITLIKQIKGTYDTWNFNIHNDIEGLTNGTLITLTNVVIDNNSGKEFFTFEGNFYEGKNKLHENYMPGYMKLLMPKTPFSQREGLLLPLTIKSSDIEKIKAAVSRQKSAIKSKEQ